MCNQTKADCLKYVIIPVFDFLLGKTEKIKANSVLELITNVFKKKEK